MTIIDEIENEAREAYRCGSGMANRMIGQNQVGCHIISAMINRGTATGDTKRATWTINGKRASRAACEELACMPVPKTDQRPYPELLTSDESKTLLTMAEQLWSDLQANNLGGFSSGNRPFYILWKFKTVIEQFGHRDVGQSWSKNDLDEHPERPQ